MHPVQSDAVDKLSKGDFIGVLARLGYSFVKEPGQLEYLSNGPSRVTIFLGEDSDVTLKKRCVRSASAFTEFDLPRMLPKSELIQLANREGIRAEVNSFLDGKVSLKMYLWGESDGLNYLKQNLATCFDSVRRLQRALQPLGGSQSRSSMQMGSAAFDPDLALREVDEQDLMFLAWKAGWRDSGAGGSRSNWSVSGKPLGLSLDFRNFDKERLRREGYEEAKAGFFVDYSKICNESALDGFMASPDANVSWGHLSRSGKVLRIGTFIDTTKGPTVRRVVGEVEDFALRIIGLNLRTDR